MELLVDGHNLMFAASESDERYNVERGEAAREEVLALLARYQAIKGDRILCFFDGGAGGGGLPRHTFGHGLQIVYSDPKSDADTEIKNHVARHHAPSQVLVVTSDNAIQAFVRRLGVETIPSQRFLRRMRELLAESGHPDDEPPEKFDGADDEEADFWMRVFGVDDEEE